MKWKIQLDKKFEEFNAKDSVVNSKGQVFGILNLNHWNFHNICVTPH